MTTYIIISSRVE